MTNETEGGDGREKGFKHKPMSVQKIVAALKERSPEIRRMAALKTSQKLKGRSLPEEQRRKLSTSHKEHWKTLSGESREAILKNLRHGWPQELRDRVSEFRRGKKHTKATSSYLGVSWFKRDSNWRAWLKYNGKQLHLGYFSSEKEAALDYNKKAVELFGEFARLNVVA